MMQCQANRYQSEKIWLRQIIKQGSNSRRVAFPVTFPESWAWPREGIAWFIADLNQSLPLLNGVIKGTIRYVGQSFQELQFAQEVSLMLPEIPVVDNTEPVLLGQINELAWRPDRRHTNVWIVEVALDFYWYLTKFTLLPCLIGPGDGEPVVKINAPQLLFCKDWQFLHTVRMTAISATLSEVQVMLRKKKETRTKKGLLLTAELSLEAYFAHDSGKEVYQSRDTEFNKLITPEQLPLGVGPEVRPETRVTATVQHYNYHAGQLCVAVGLRYECRFWQARAVEALLKPDAVCNVLALTLREPAEFTLTGQAQLQLRQWPVQIQKVNTELIRLVIVPQTGKIDVCGQQEVMITYCDRMRRQRADIYHLFFQESFNWRGVVPDDQFDYQARLEWNGYTLIEQQVYYRYWWQLQINGGQLKALPLKLEGPRFNEEDAPKTDPAMVGLTESPVPVRLTIERELSLPAGSAALSRVCQITLEHFRCYDAGKAFRIEGWFRIELEGGGRGLISRCESLRLPFWQFVSAQEVPVAKLQQIQAQIRHWECRLDTGGTGRKRRIKVRVELELQ
jgi:hypothetical protein